MQSEQLTLQMGTNMAIIAGAITNISITNIFQDSFLNHINHFFFYRINKDFYFLVIITWDHVTSYRALIVYICGFEKAIIELFEKENKMKNATLPPAQRKPINLIMEL